MEGKFLTDCIKLKKMWSDICDTLHFSRQQSYNSQLAALVNDERVSLTEIYHHIISISSADVREDQLPRCLD